MGLWQVLCLSVSLAPAAAGSPPGDPLTPGQTLRRTIQGGQVHSFRVTVTEGQWFQINARALRLSLDLALKAPDGRTLFESYPAYVGDTEAAPVWVAEVPGTYTLEASVWGRSKGRGSYELRLSPPRSAGPEDHKRVLAQSLRMDSRRLMVSPDRERLAQARQKCDAGMAIARELADPRLESRFHRCLRVVLHNAGDSRGAFEAAQRALALDRQAYPRAEAGDRMDMATFYFRSGDYQQALEQLEQARAILHSLDDDVGEAIALGNLGALYSELNEHSKALQLSAQAGAILRSHGSNLNVARNHTRSGDVLLALGQLARARQSFERALVLFQAEKRPVEEGMAWAQIGIVHHRLGQYEEALRFLHRGLELVRDNRNIDEAFVLQNLGDVYRKRGEHDKALEHYRLSLPIAGAGGRTRDQIGTLTAIAALESDRGNLAEARRQIERVTRWFDDTRQGLVSEDLRLSYSGLLREAYDVHVDVLMRLHVRSPGEGHDRRALELSERGRSQTLMETLREAKALLTPEIEPGLLQRANEVREKLNAKAMLQMTQAAQDGTILAQEIAELTRQQDQIRTEIRKASPRYSALSQPAALATAELQALLGDETVLLEYQIGTDGSYAWAVAPDALASAPLGKGNEIEALARRLHEHLTARNRPPAGATAAEFLKRLARAERAYAQAARELSEKVLGPLPAPSGKRLAVVADGALHYVPFAALPAPASWGGKAGPLIDRYEVVNLPSASVLDLLRRDRQERSRAPKEAAIFADPVFDRRDARVRRGQQPRATLRPERAPRRSVFASSTPNLNLFRPGLTMGGTMLPRLAYTRQLADAVLQGLAPEDGFRAVDFAASREAALDPSLAEYRTVVFATHGIANAQYPELSGIALSMVDEQGAPKQGFLRLHDVYNLKLNADLVVLGACETGLGKEVRGEGLIGLSRGFMYAGAARVLASLWKVDEEATMALIKEFHRSVQQGRSHPAALRDAQHHVRQQSRWRSPYYWAGFVLQGDWDRPR